MLLVVAGFPRILFKIRRRKMKKKIISAVLSCSVLFGAFAVCAFAKGITGITDGNSIRIEANDKKIMIVSGYDKNGVLKNSALVKASEDGYFSLSADFAQYAWLRAAFMDNDIFYDLDITEGTIPTAEPTIAPTAAPSPTASPASKPVQTKLPLKSAYEREVDAMNAFAVVTSVSSVVNDDDEECYRVGILYQGYEMAVDIKKSIAITSSSDAFAFMNGCDAGALEEGDVIFFTAKLSGEINSLSFIMRAVTPDILTDGNDYGASFEKLFTDNGTVAGNVSWDTLSYGGSTKGGKYQFAFGVVFEKSGKAFSLLGPDGSIKNEIYINLADDTPVYVCDVSGNNKASKVSLGNISSITKSSLSAKTETIKYDGKTKINYALVRLVNGTASDIVIYKNK